MPIKISVGLDDEFLKEQLLIDNFLIQAKEKNFKIDYSALPHYDHRNYFIASYVESHLKFHHQFFK